jgi:hypothetical protein
VPGHAAQDEQVGLSYHDLADRLGIKTASAKRRAIDRKWPKRIGNDGRSLVAVPREIIEEAAGENTGVGTREATDEDAGEAWVILKEELAEVRQELRAARAEAAEARDRAVKAETEAEHQGRAVTELRQELQARTAEAEARRTEAAEARERAARAEGQLEGMRSRGLWARLWGRG